MATGAVFPNGVASFPDHQNLIEDIDASHINRIQAEVTAIEQVLGAEVNLVQQVQVNVAKQNALLQAQAGQLATQAGQIATQGQTLSQEQALINGITAQTQVITTKYNSLSDQLNAIRRGDHIYAATSLSRMLNYPNTGAPYNFTPVQLAPLSDPMGMWNGNGFTLPVDGLWFLQGSVVVYPQGTPSQNKGNYAASLTLNGYGDYGGRIGSYYNPGNNGQQFEINMASLLWYNAGMTVNIDVAQDSGHNQVIESVFLNAVRLRG